MAADGLFVGYFSLKSFHGVRSGCSDARPRAGVSACVIEGWALIGKVLVPQWRDLAVPGFSHHCEFRHRCASGGDAGKDQPQEQLANRSFLVTSTSPFGLLGHFPVCLLHGAYNSVSGLWLLLLSSLVLVHQRDLTPERLTSNGLVQPDCGCLCMWLELEARSCLARRETFIYSTSVCPDTLCAYIQRIFICWCWMMKFIIHTHDLFLWPKNHVLPLKPLFSKWSTGVNILVHLITRSWFIPAAHRPTPTTASPPLIPPGS